MAMVAILIFAGASFFFALAETALFSLSKWQARQLAEGHPRAGKIVVEMLERPQDLLATLALTIYPLAFPQLTRLITGQSPLDSRFQKDYAAFLRRFAAAFQPTTRRRKK